MAKKKPKKEREFVITSVVRSTVCKRVFVSGYVQTYKSMDVHCGKEIQVHDISYEALAADLQKKLAQAKVDRLMVPKECDRHVYPIIEELADIMQVKVKWEDVYVSQSAMAS